MKIATFNVNSLRKRLPIVLDWLQRHKPDVLCLQETKVQDADFPSLALASTGYHVTFRGVKSYSGVAVLSRTEPEAVSYGLDDGGSPDEERLLRVVVRGIPIINTYVPQALSRPPAIHLLGLPQAELAGRQQRVAHRPHPRDPFPGRALHEVRRGCRAPAGPEPVRPHVSLGRVCDVAAETRRRHTYCLRLPGSCASMW